MLLDNYTSTGKVDGHKDMLETQAALARNAITSSAPFNFPAIHIVVGTSKISSLFIYNVLYNVLKTH